MNKKILALGFWLLWSASVSLFAALENNGNNTVKQGNSTNKITTPAIWAVKLIDTTTGIVIKEFTEGENSLCYDNLPETLSLIAETSVGTVGSVEFRVMPTKVFVDNIYPFRLKEHSSGLLKPFSPSVGIKTLAITPYQLADLNGNVGSTKNFTINVSDDLLVCDDVVNISGELKQWHRVRLDLLGPDISELDINNPFRNYKLDVTFTHIDTGESLVVPGFFAADGDAENTSADSGNIWRTYFRPHLIGNWEYSVSFIQGTNVSVANSVSGTPVLPLNGLSGEFYIGNSDKFGNDFRSKGFLRHEDGERYLQFSGTNDYFLKMGANSPENLLAYSEFDQTSDLDPAWSSFLHSYSPHAVDFHSWDSLDTDSTWSSGKGKNLIGGNKLFIK